MRFVSPALAVGVALCACSGNGDNVGPASQLAFKTGPGSAIVGQAISPSVEVSIQDASGNLLTNSDAEVTVTLLAGSSGATLTGTTTVTAANGIARFADLQISRPGSGFTLQASAASLAPATTAAFDVSFAAGFPITIAAAAGQRQTGTVGELVSIPPQVLITDGFGNPVANVGVAFQVGLGSGSVTEAQVTGPDGVATALDWHLGTVAGPNLLLAKATGLEGSPISFDATALPGPAAELWSHAADSQFTHVGTAVEEPPAVLITDLYGNPVAGTEVHFTVTSGGGKVAGGVQTTPETGVAQVESWTLGTHQGANTLAAGSTGLFGSPFIFTATGVKGTAVEVRNNYFHSVHNGSGGAGTYPFVKAAYDTIAAGETVTWIWVGEGHNVSSLSMSGTHDAPHTFSITFETPGHYQYACTNHSQVVQYLGLVGMRGYIEVR